MDLKDLSCFSIFTQVEPSLVPRLLPDFISQPWRKINSPQLLDKIWEWPGNKTRLNFGKDTYILQAFSALEAGLPIKLGRRVTKILSLRHNR